MHTQPNYQSICNATYVTLLLKTARASRFSSCLSSLSSRSCLRTSSSRTCSSNVPIRSLLWRIRSLQFYLWDLVQTITSLLSASRYSFSSLVFWPSKLFCFRKSLLVSGTSRSSISCLSLLLLMTSQFNKSNCLKVKVKLFPTPLYQNLYPRLLL